MASIFRQTYTKRDPKTGRTIRKKSQNYYIDYRDERGCRKRVPGFTDKEMTRRFARELETQAEAIRRGCAAPFELHMQRPLQEHLEDYTKHLEAKGDCDRYVREIKTKIQLVFSCCKFGIWSDISASLFCQWLMERKRERGWGARTYNAYTRALRSFCRWLVMDQRAPSNPVEFVKDRNEQLDRKHFRRVLTSTEFRKLIQAARAGEEAFGLSGRARAMLYATAALTGFRAKELASLTPSSFDYEMQPPSVTLAVEDTKSKRPCVLPIRSDLAGLLRPWLEMIAPDQRLWPGSWQCKFKGSPMIQIDLKAAGIPYKDERGHVYDFHALRHQFVTLAVESGVNIKVVQMLARHTTAAMTLGVYAHASMDDAADAIERLPLDRLTNLLTNETVTPCHSLSSPGTQDTDVRNQNKSTCDAGDSMKGAGKEEVEAMGVTCEAVESEGFGPRFRAAASSETSLSS